MRRCAYEKQLKKRTKQQGQHLPRAVLMEADSGTSGGKGSRWHRSFAKSSNRARPGTKLCGARSKKQQPGMLRRSPLRLRCQLSSSSKGLPLSRNGGKEKLLPNSRLSWVDAVRNLVRLRLAVARQRLRSSAGFWTRQWQQQLRQRGESLRPIRRWRGWQQSFWKLSGLSEKSPKGIRGQGWGAGAKQAYA